MGSERHIRKEAVQEEAIRRNRDRAAEVPEDTIRKISQELESPLSYGGRYDRATLECLEGTCMEVIAWKIYLTVGKLPRMPAKQQKSMPDPSGCLVPNF